MRKALYLALTMTGDKAYNISQSGTRVLPYYLLKFGSSINTDLGSYTTFNVTAYANPGDVSTLDTMCADCLTRIKNKKLSRVSDGCSFIPEFVGETDDFVDDELNALGKRLSFRVPKFGSDYL